MYEEEHIGEPANASLDFGRRFWIDTLLDDPSISPEELDYLRHHMLAMVPVSAERFRYRNDKSIADNFLDNYPGKERMLPTLLHLQKKVSKQKFLSYTFPVMAIQLTNWYNKQLDPEEMRKLYAWAEATCSSSDEYMQLTDFPKISSTTQNSSLNYTLDAVLDKIEKPEGWKKQINNEAKTEVFDDLETEFGIDFRPPIELP